MKCERVREAMQELLRDAVREEEAREIRHHLASCAACASKISPEGWVEILPVLDKEIEPSRDFAMRFHTRLRERQRSQIESDRTPSSLWMKLALWIWPRRLATAGILTVLIVAGIFIGRFPGSFKDAAISDEDLSIAQKLPILEDMAVINNLDLLEDFETIETLAAGPENSKTPRSDP
jgi:hypothetical protein